MIHCPNCGALAKDEIQIYNESLRKQNFSLSPVLPVCKRCGADVAVHHGCGGGNVVVLNGTCGSGKSTIAELLAAKGYLAIDGDCAIQAVKYKRNAKQVDFHAIAEEIACELDILSLFGENFVVSAVIMPEDLDQYVSIFESRNVSYQFFLLRPAYRTAVERCQARTCHGSVTPEYWIEYFYDRLQFDGRVIVIDNTDLTAEETAEHIWRYL